MEQFEQRSRWQEDAELKRQNHVVLQCRKCAGSGRISFVPEYTFSGMFTRDAFFYEGNFHSQAPMPRMITCEVCNGSGYDPKANTQFVVVSNGYGQNAHFSTSTKQTSGPHISY